MDIDLRRLVRSLVRSGLDVGHVLDAILGEMEKPPTTAELLEIVAKRDAGYAGHDHVADCDSGVAILPSFVANVAAHVRPSAALHRMIINWREPAVARTPLEISEDEKRRVDFALAVRGPHDHPFTGEAQRRAVEAVSPCSCRDDMSDPNRKKKCPRHGVEPWLRVKWLVGS